MYYKFIYELQIKSLEILFKNWQFWDYLLWDYLLKDLQLLKLKQTWIAYVCIQCR